MSTKLDNDTDVIESLDFDFEPPCESAQGCDRVATWQIRVACCGHLWLLCQTCMDIVLESVASAKYHPEYTFNCAACKVEFPIAKLIHSMEPL